MSLSLKQIYDRCDEFGECQLWKQSTINGHPQAYIDGKGGTMVRRYIFLELLGKALKKGQILTTRCRNSLCLAVDCIQVITYSKRLQLAYTEGGRSTPGEYLSRVRRHVEQGKTTLDFEKAAAIRASTATNAELAEEYHVHPKTIASVRSGRSWRSGAINASVFSLGAVR